MSSPSIRVVLPLADAHTNRRAGGKAICLSKLIAARFSVPKGFVLSADAYRSHLWTSGAREIASAQAEAEQREAIRGAILAQPIPDDVWQSVADAYERLSWQTGDAEPKVAVRPSAIEDSRGGSGFSGAYESYLNVSGLENLDAAIKRVWASLWSGKAAAYRARYGSPTEPAMGVIIQQMLEADLVGSAFTANPVTGDPTSVGVIVSGEGESGQYTVSLSDFSVSRAAAPDQGHDDEQAKQREAALKRVAEQSILIEDTIGGRVEVEWAIDRGGLWILQAGPMTDLPEYFPAEASSGSVWTRDDERPASHLGRSLIGSEHCVRAVNGHIYSVAEAVDTRTATTLTKDWEKHSPALQDRVSKSALANPASLDEAALTAALRAAVDDVRIAFRWMRDSERLAETSVSALAEVVEDSALLRRLLGGIRDIIFERDALLQELSERFAISEKSGKLEDEKWWRDYRSDVKRFARQFGYSYRDPGDAADLSRWKSWVEDTDSVFRMIGAISKRGDKPTLVTLHAAAESDAAAAATDALSALAGAKQSHFRRLLDSARASLCLRSAAQQLSALASTSCRRILMEQANRLDGAGAVGSREDIFHLDIGDLLAGSRSSAETSRRELSARIARRKHELWLEQRLTAPETLPPEQADSRTDDSRREASPGTASGCARIISTVEEAAEIDDGDIIITKWPAAAWTPFLAIADGLISEYGSEFSPCAMLARTYGIPAVVGYRGAPSAIREGQRITLGG